MTYSAQTIAKWFVAWAEADDDGEGNLTNLKLQKLLYYAQGHYLAQHGEPLFDDRIQARKHGPVVASVYQQWKSDGAQELHLPDDDTFEFSDVDEDTTKFLLDVWNRYGSLAAWRLRDMTHEEPPWRDVYKPGEAGTVIDQKAMQKYFRSLYGKA